MPVISFDDGRLGFEVNFCGTREEFIQRHPTITRWLGVAIAEPSLPGFVRPLNVTHVTPEQLVNDQTYKTVTGKELAATPEGRAIIGEELAKRIDNPGLGDALAEDPKSLDGSWICGTSLDDGEFSIGETYATREDALAGAPEELGCVEVGGFFQTAQLRFQRSVPDFPWDGDNLLDQLSDGMSSDWHESAIENAIEKASPHLAELDAKLQALWASWTEKYDICVEGYLCDHVESHELTQEMADKVELKMKEWEAKHAAKAQAEEK